jgi:hypothetical protein
MKQVIRVENGRYDVMDDEGDIVSYEISSEDDLNALETLENKKTTPQEYEFGRPIIAKTAILGSSGDLYPNHPTPPASVRFQYYNLTPEIFDTIRPISDKRLTGLIFWYANKRNNIVNRPPSDIVKHTRSWLLCEDGKQTNEQFYMPWNVKLRKIINEHKKQGDSDTPWLEFYVGIHEGKKTQKARVRWDKDYSVAMKNAYYQNR